MSDNPSEFKQAEQPQIIELQPYYVMPSQTQSGGAGSRCCAWSCGCCVTLFCVLPLVCGGLFGALAAIIGGNEVTKRETKTIAIEERTEGTITLDVSNNLGNIEIIGQDGVEEIEVEIVRRGWGLTDGAAEGALDDLKVNLRRVASRYYVEAESSETPGFLLQGGSIDLKIVAPRSLALVISHNFGNITIRNVNIVGNMSISNNIGEVRFEGLLASAGKSEISLNVGGVELTVERESSFRYTADTNIGEVDATWDVTRDNRRSDSGPTQSVEGVYGEARNPTSTLQISVNMGGIILRD